MKLEASEIITQYGGEIRENYSGRGMFGKTTTGIVFESKAEYNNAIAEIMENEEQEERETVAEALRNIKFDSMGLEIIVY